MAEDITLRVITPDHIVVDTTASSVRIPGVDGSLGILRNHAPMIAAIDVGLLRFRHAGKEHALFVAGGFAEVRNNTVRVVSEAGERPEEIDLARAKEAEERARQRLEEGRHGADVDVLRAELALRRAQIRLRARGYAGTLV
jgi:F-type H+-transporting ATPase subunit epsilon